MKQYVIQSGDNLTRIAQAHGTDINSILQANPNIKDPNLIYAGGTLNIPDGSPDQSTPHPDPSQPTSAPDNPTVNNILNQFASPSGVVTSDAARNQQPAPDLNPPNPIQNDVNQVNQLREGLNPPNIPVPGAPPNLAEKFQQLRADPGTTGVSVADLETQLNQTKASRLNLEGTIANLRTQLSGQGRPQADVDQAVQEKTAEIKDQLDQYTRQEQVLTDQLSTRYRVIESVMQFTNQDYQNSVQQYDREFLQNLRILSAVKGEQALADTQQERAKDDARANLQIMANQISTNGLSYDQLSDSQRAMISKLELQAGLPTGFLENLRVKNPRADILSIINRNDNGKQYADILTRDPETGAISVEHQFIGNAKTPTSLTEVGGRRVLIDNQTGQVIADLGPTRVTGTGLSTSQMFTKAERAKLEATIGLETGGLIGQAILNGHSLEDIRRALRTDKKDPAILDTFDRVVGIGKFTKNTRPKATYSPPVTR